MTKITPDHLARSAFVYVRQSTAMQVTHNLESQRQQYRLADRARTGSSARNPIRRSSIESAPTLPSTFDCIENGSLPPILCSPKSSVRHSHL